MVDVVLIASSFFPRVGGVEEHVRRVASELRDRGMDVVVWTVDQGDDVPTELDGIRVHALPCPTPARSLRAVTSFAWRLPRAALQWRRMLRRDRPRILHVHCFGPNGVWATAIARIARIPIVVTSHGETFGDANGVFDQSALLRSSLRRALATADAVTACSAFTARDLESRFALSPGRASIIANGVDLNEPAGELPPDLPVHYFFALGRAVATKGFDLLLKAFACATLPSDAQLVIGGDGPELPALAALAAQLGVAERVRFLGSIGRGQVVAVAKGALAMVVSSRVESFGIVLLEGWRAGVPVIATTHGGPATLINDGVDGWLVDPFDTHALAESLSRVVDDPVEAAAIGRRGLARAGEFTWAKIAEQYADVYASVLAGQQRG